MRVRPGHTASYHHNIFMTRKHGVGVSHQTPDFRKTSDNIQMNPIHKWITPFPSNLIYLFSWMEYKYKVWS